MKPQPQSIEITRAIKHAIKRATKRNLKTLLLFIDDKGGVGKSANCAHMIDALRKFGYSVRIGDADHINRTLQQLIPSGIIPVDARKPTDLLNFIIATGVSQEDVSVLDMPGSSIDLLAQTGVAMESFEQTGVRIVIVINLTQTVDAALGAREWIRKFGTTAEYFVVANEKDTPFGENFDADRVPGLRAIINRTGGQIAVIPKFSPIMLDQYHKQKSHPSGYLAGGQAATTLNINIVYSSIWQTHFQRVLLEFEPFAEWLTGKPIPTPLATDADSRDDAEPDRGMDDLCDSLDALIPNQKPQ